jgi:flagellar biogenesis protein FliO
MLDTDEMRASEEQVAQRRKDLFTIVGSMAGIVALLGNFYWTISNAQRSYVQVALEVRVVGSIETNEG